MNTREVENILRSDCKLSTIFEGVYASDRLPLFCNYNNTALVMNLDPHNQSGSHWVSIYIENGYGLYFDSYGMPPTVNANFVHFLNRNCTQGWDYNRTELQALDSDVCGHYCIWFLSERARGVSLKNIVNQFTANCTVNDKLVKQNVVKRYGSIVAKLIANVHMYYNYYCQSCTRRLKS